MKFYKYLIIAFLLLGCSNLLISEETAVIKPFPQYGRKAQEVSLNKYDLQKLYGKPANQLLGASFTIFDTLANSLSYCGSSTTPFVYDPRFNYLITIKRGSKEVTDNGWSTLNSKNNLFLRFSSDNGYTWQPQIKVYDEIESKVGSGRYPSCATFSYNGKLAVAFAGSLVNEASGSWLGQITGIWDEQGDIGIVHSPKCIANGTAYDWGVSDAVVHGYISSSSELCLIAADIITPTPGSFTDNGNIGIRKSIELGEPETWIPDAWKSDLFYPVDNIDYRPNEIIGLRQKSLEANSPLYLGVFGNFKVTPDYEKAKPGFSISTDNGDTWQPFVIMDSDLLNNYTISLGLEKDSSAFLYDSKDFTVLSNGDVYFVLHFREINADKLTSEEINQIVEVKYTAQNQSWSISKIADITGLWLNVVDENLSPIGSPTDIELQIAKTTDESKLFVKWVDLLDITWVDADHYQFRTSDIFYSGKNLAAGTGWSTPHNLTSSDEYDRQTKIAPIVPQDLTDIPILKLQTILNPNNNETPGTQEYLTAMRQYLRPQEVQIGHFDAVLGINDHDQTIIARTEINRIYPNPAQNSTTLEYSIKGLTNIDIALYDLMGNKLINIYSGMQSDGVYSYNVNTKDLLSGTYYISIKYGNNTVSKIINIVK